MAPPKNGKFLAKKKLTAVPNGFFLSMAHSNRLIVLYLVMDGDFRLLFWFKKIGQKSPFSFSTTRLWVHISSEEKRMSLFAGHRLVGVVLSFR